MIALPPSIEQYFAAANARDAALFAQAFAEDAEVAISIDFEGERVVFRDGIIGIPNLMIRGGFEHIGDLSRMEAIGALPDPRGAVNKALFAAMRRGELRVHGLPQALPLLLGFSDVMHVA